MDAYSWVQILASRKYSLRIVSPGFPSMWLSGLAIMFVAVWFLGQIIFPARLLLTLPINQMKCRKDEAMKNAHLLGPCEDARTHDPLCDVLII